MSYDNAVTSYSALALSPVTATRPNAAPAKQGEDIDAIAKDFESVFLSQMMANMFSGEDANSYFGKGTAGEIYKSFLMNEYGKSVANTGGIGIADIVKQELLKMQEVAP